MANFNNAFDLLMKLEGGYSNDRDDAGGETYKGISRRFHPSWGCWLTIDSLKKNPNFPICLDRDPNIQSLVELFYKQMFWDRIQGDSISDQNIAEELFDTSVNMGITRSVTFLQRGLNYLNRNGKLYPNMVEDGQLGPVTLSNLNKYLKNEISDILFKIMNVLQANHYLTYMSKSPTQEKYCRGWFRRVTFSKK